MEQEKTPYTAQYFSFMHLQFSGTQYYQVLELSMYADMHFYAFYIL